MIPNSIAHRKLRRNRLKTPCLYKRRFAFFAYVAVPLHTFENIWRKPVNIHENAAEAALIYVTCGDHAEAEKIGRALLEERLAACVNIFDNMHSLYWWQGALEEGHESVLIIKSRLAASGAITERVRALHSYTTPCVVVFPIQGGNPDYLEWIAKETDNTL
jgi:periplasmic divalent cation tolerance protein